MNRVHIGTSGWAYKSWEHSFCPAGLPKKRTQFSTVEINATFYRLPSPNTVSGWRNKAPAGFVYAVKTSRFITHMKKLADLNGALDKFFERISPMRSRIRVVLWQLPSNLHRDESRLESFLKQLPKGYRYAVEFRHSSWLEEACFALLRKHNIAHVSVSSLRMPMNLTVTADLIYIRFHGLEGGAAHDYTAD